jgi:hypothetical protein
MSTKNRFIRQSKVFLLLYLCEMALHESLLHGNAAAILFIFSLPVDLTMELIAPREEKVIKQVLQPGSREIEVTGVSISQSHVIWIKPPAAVEVWLSLWGAIDIEHKWLLNILFVEVNAHKVSAFWSQRETDRRSERVGNTLQMLGRTTYSPSVDEAIQISCVLRQ